MRRARWACCAISTWLLACPVDFAEAQDGSQRITQVELQVTRLGPGASADALRPDAQAPWQRIELPLSRDPPELVARGEGAHLVWLRFQYRPQHSGATALFASRADLGEVFVLMNDRRLDDGHWQHSPRWNSPLLFVAPPDALRRDADNQILIAMVAPMDRLRFGSIEIGPADGVVLDHYERRLFLAETLPRIATGLHLALAVFAFAVWWRRRNESPYLMLTLNMVAWAVFLLPFYYYPPVPFDAFSAYWNLTAAALAWVVALNYLFAARLAGASRSVFESALLVYAVVSSSITLALIAVDSEWTFTLYRLTVFQLPALVGLVVAAATVRLAWRSRTREVTAVAAAIVAQYALGLHDALRIRGLLSADNAVLVPFSALLILTAFGYGVLRRYVGLLAAAEQSARTLDLQLAERTRELEASHARLREIEREQALAEERQRLMREMHDGMGSALMGSLLMVEQGRLDHAAVAQVLRESIGDLTLMVDSLEPYGGDLLPLLATLRYRLGRRLEGAGLAMRWSVSELPPLPWLDATTSLHVLRILQEALINVARHAQAGTVGIETEADGQGVSVRIVDDGRGFDVDLQLDSGRGLRNMMRRAQALGGSVTVVSRPGKTVLTLRLPREHAGGPAAAAYNRPGQESSP